MHVNYNLLDALEIIMKRMRYQLNDKVKVGSQIYPIW